jgi:hypothetical protein
VVIIILPFESELRLDGSKLPVLFSLDGPKTDWTLKPDLPLGAVTVVALIFMFKPPTRAVERKPVPERIKRLDLLGAAIFVPAVFMILLALQWGGVKYAWSSSRIIGLFVGGGVTLILFAAYQGYKGDMAMIPPSILTNRTVLFASLAAMFGMAAQSLMGMWMPEWFQVRCCSLSCATQT